LDFVCRFFDRDGKAASFAPDNILRRASESLFKSSGLQLRALGELEFYLLSNDPSHLYRTEQQRGYHASAPFVKSGDALDEMLRYLEQITGAVKYGHGEVGWIGSVESEVPELRRKIAEQFEIEFLPRPVDECADALALAKWIIRNVAYRHGSVATFTPKLEDGVAGNGMHVHMELIRNDRNVMTRHDGSLSNEALRLIGGLCANADVLTAFGNTLASSFLRLVPNQEAPTHICWSDMNRSTLIRVPLGWNNVGNLADAINPREPAQNNEPCQTVELRTPDGSALIHLLLAGIARAAEWGLNEPTALQTAQDRYVTEIGMNGAEVKVLPSLPHSCAEAGALLQERREFFEREELFPARLSTTS
jgi:glutamine synthetase